MIPKGQPPHTVWMWSIQAMWLLHSDKHIDGLAHPITNSLLHLIVFNPHRIFHLHLTASIFLILGDWRNPIPINGWAKWICLFVTNKIKKASTANSENPSLFSLFPKYADIKPTPYFWSFSSTLAVAELLLETTATVSLFIIAFAIIFNIVWVLPVHTLICSLNLNILTTSDIVPLF